MLAPCPEQTGNLRRSALGGELPERRPAPVRRAGERRQAREEAADPLRFALPHREGQVVDLDGQKAAELAQVLDGPARRRRAESVVPCIHVRSVLHQEARHFLIPAKGGVVKGRGSLGISSRHERQPLGEEVANATEISGGDGFE
jgi:hypothetical protein